MRQVCRWSTRSPRDDAALRPRGRAPILKGVRFLSSILMLIGALAVLSLGAVGASAAPVSAPPCHEAGGPTSDSSDHSPKAMKAMICCAACVAAPSPTCPPLPGLPVSPSRLAAGLIDMPAGRLLSPEPGPPRLSIA